MNTKKTSIMRMRSLFPSIAFALALAGCATAPAEPMLAQSSADLRQRAVQSQIPTAPVTTDLAVPVPPTIVKGTDVMIAKPSARGAVSVSGKGVKLHFESAPVTEVLHAVLGDLLKLDYAIVGPLAGEITIHTQAEVPRDQVLTLLDAVLQANNIVMVPDAAGRYRVGSADTMKTVVPIPRRTTALPTGFGSVIVPLQFIGAAEMAQILGPLANEQALLRVDTVRNLLMLAGSRSQIEGWLEIINTFDVDFLKGMSVGLFPLTHASVKDVEPAVRALLGGDGQGGRVDASTTPGQGAAGSSGSEGGRSGARGPDLTNLVDRSSPLAGVLRVLPIERLNALLVITPRAHYLEQARQWIERFDRPSDGEADGRLYVYPVQNGSATHLAKLLNGLYGAAAGVRAKGDTGVAPALAATSQASRSGTYSAFSGGGGAGLGLGLGMLGGAPYGGAPSAGQLDATQTNVTLENDIRVVADESNNALLIHASRRHYRRIEAALRQLDVAPTQVLIEASILEVTLNDDIRYGLQWYFNDKTRSGLDGSGQLTSSASGALGAINPGFSYSLVDSVGSVRAVLNALAQKSLLNVISSPSVMVLDNHTAQIQVGDLQPVRSQQTITDGGTTTSSIQYKETGVSLSVTPSVNAGDMVSMIVNQTVTDVGEIDPATEQRSFMQRQLSSRVAVRSGETIVLGGLIRDNSTRGKQGIPLLHDLPVVGHLFGTTTIDTNRTELLVMLTPKVVRTEADVREVGDELRNRMRTLTGLRLGDATLARPLPTDGSAPAVEQANPAAIGVER
jgi:general secretion pathway protein D